MLSLGYIRQLVEERTEEAREEGLKPLSIRQYRDVESFCRKIPFLGEFVHPAWERVEQVEPYFVDSSGWGAKGEPALTFGEFKAVIENWRKSGESVGFGIIEEGQFQVYIAVYKPHWRDFTRSGNLQPEDLRALGIDARLET
jgi:hypothetical protein